MKKLLYLLPLLFALHCTGQTKEQFLNAVTPLFVDSAQHYFYIDENAYTIDWKWESMDLKAMRKELSPLINDSTITQLYYTSLTDTIPKTWDCISVTHARCVNPDTLRYLAFFIYDINPRWSKKKQKKEERKQCEAQERAYAAKPKEEMNMYAFSRPAFDNTKQFAIMRITFQEKIIGGNGSSQIYLFKRINGKWTKLTLFACWSF